MLFNNFRNEVRTVPFIQFNKKGVILELTACFFSGIAVDFLGTLTTLCISCRLILPSAILSFFLNLLSLLVIFWVANKKENKIISAIVCSLGVGMGTLLAMFLGVNYLIK
jgi:hypothetical protein